MTMSPSFSAARDHASQKCPPQELAAAAPASHLYPVRQVLDLRHERLSGVIAQYLPENGYGFVTSHMFAGELVFRADRIMPEFQGHLLSENEAVEFDVQTDEQGRAHAVALKPTLGRRSHDCVGQRHRGYVRRFAERWGFLNAAAFDGDLFVHCDNLLPAVPEQGSEGGGQPPLRAGQAVEFDVALDDRGRAVAHQITTRAQLRSCDWIGHRLRGYIRSFQGAWGFINSDRFVGDLFVHRDSLLAQYQGAELEVGTLVEFDIERDQHRKTAKNRLVARHVGVLPGEAAGYAGAAAGYAAAAGVPSAYYPQDPMRTPGYGLSPYLQAQALQQQQLPPPYGGQAYGTAGPYLPQSGAAYGQPYAPLQHLGGGGYPVLPAAAVDASSPCSAAGCCRGPMLGPGGAEGAAGLVQVSEGRSEGQLHITMHDWEPDQPGQLWVTKGTLVSVSYRAPHGWVYAGTVQPGSEGGEPASEGWIPQAVVKRVSLCRVGMEWSAEGPGTLGVTKGEIVAVSKEADRGWVYGERIGPRQADRPADGWLPKKVLDYLQA